jgi:hypothetical protein
LQLDLPQALYRFKPGHIFFVGEFPGFGVYGEGGKVYGEALLHPGGGRRDKGPKVLEEGLGGEHPGRRRASLMYHQLPPFALVIVEVHRPLPGPPQPGGYIAVVGRLVPEEADPEGKAYPRRVKAEEPVKDVEAQFKLPPQRFRIRTGVAGGAGD